MNFEFLYELVIPKGQALNFVVLQKRKSTEMDFQNLGKLSAVKLTNQYFFKTLKDLFGVFG